MLAEDLEVSVGTLRKALELLESQHVVVRQQGRGTFVADYTADSRPTHFLNLRASDGSLLSAPPEVLVATCGQATAEEAERLGLPAGTEVKRRHCVRRLADTVFAVEYTSLPSAMFPELTRENAAHWEVHNLAQHHGIIVGRMVERILCRVPPPEAATLLDIGHDIHVMTLDRIVHAIDGAAIEWRMAYCLLGEGFYLNER